MKKALKERIESLEVDWREHIDKPLWCIYGVECFAHFFCCKITHGYKGPNIWGFSVYKRQSGFRTLGVNAEKWIAEQGYPVRFFANQADALEWLAAKTDPERA